MWTMFTILCSVVSEIELKDEYDSHQSTFYIHKGDTVKITLSKEYGGFWVFDPSHVDITAYHAGKKYEAESKVGAIDFGNSKGSVEIKATKSHWTTFGAVIWDGQCNKRIYSSKPFDWLTPNDFTGTQICYIHGGPKVTLYSSLNPQLRVDSGPKLFLANKSLAASPIGVGLGPNQFTIVQTANPCQLVWKDLGQENAKVKIEMTSFDDEQKFKLRGAATGTGFTSLKGRNAIDDNKIEGSSIAGLVVAIIFLVTVFVVLYFCIRQRPTKDAIVEQE